VNIITEPIGRNTAPAIAFAMAYCRDVLKCNDKEIMFVGPSDHLIKPVEKFRKLVADNVPVAEKGLYCNLGYCSNWP
jgi:mannose-1-phosphate guanylyltransferase/mannose-6-phosphate isomerase